MAANIVKTKPGDQYHDLTVLSKHPERRHGHVMWRCQCKCGRVVLKIGTKLVTGKTKTCGCRPGSLRHGHTRLYQETRTYRIWRNMTARCRRANHPDYPDYGGRGVTVCERWKTFDNFLADMGECPTGMQIDRFPNNNGNYEPGNCRWATGSQNCRNKRNNHLVTYNGKTQCIAAWADELGIPYMVIYNRVASGKPLC
jgi:hypothetical protein